MTKSALDPFGLEIGGVDLAASHTIDVPDLIATIAAARVVVIREQTIDDAAFVRFMKHLGTLTFTEGETPVATEPDLNVVSNVGRTTPPRSVFHTDTSYVRRPPSLTALRPVRLPARGGATLFTDQVDVARRLPTQVRERLRGRTVLHTGGAPHGTTVAHRHPLFRRHPITGDVALYLSTPERCSQLSDSDARTSDRVIAALYAQSTQRSARYRHAWRAGDILIWDNRVTMHRAEHDDVDGDRVLHRAMVRGEVPVGE
jgi:taurine dioxygenase